MNNFEEHYFSLSNNTFTIDDIKKYIESHSKNDWFNEEGFHILYDFLKDIWTEQKYKDFYDKRVKIMKKFIDSGMDPDEYARKSKSLTILNRCCGSGDLDLTKILLESGANPNGISDDRAIPPLISSGMATVLRESEIKIGKESFIYFDFDKQRELVKQLLKFGANPKHKWKDKTIQQHYDVFEKDALKDNLNRAKSTYEEIKRLMS